MKIVNDFEFHLNKFIYFVTFMLTKNFYYIFCLSVILILILIQEHSFVVSIFSMDVFKIMFNKKLLKVNKNAQLNGVVRI